MPGISPTLQSQVQEIRSQNLAALMAAVDAIAAPGGAASVGTQSPSAPAALAKTPLVAPAIVVEAPQSGRILIEIAGQSIALDLPPALQRLAAQQPELFARGAQLPAQLSAQGVRLLPIVPPAVPLPLAAATIRSLSTSAPAAQSPVEAAPALANAFPVGSIGAAITRLTGIAFPIAERALASVPLTGEHPPLPRVPLPALSALAPGLSEAIVRSSALHMPLASAITQLLAQPGVPEAAQVLQQLGSLRLDGLAKPDAAAIEQAIRRSGVFLESQIAQLGAGRSDSGFQPDVKSALLALKAIVEPKLLDRPGPPATPEASAPTTPKLPAQGVPRETVAGREPSLLSAPADLARLVEGAIERVKLSQLASLPDQRQMPAGDDRTGGMRLALSLPLATQGMDRPQTATIGLVIEHSPQQVHGEFEVEAFSCTESEEPFPWKVRIAVDLEETGPVQAEIALRGQAIAITLWAERKAMAGLARAEIGNLHEALTKASFDVTRLEVRDGRPMGVAGQSVPVLDRRS